MSSKKVAVIGLGCFYAGSKNPLELWENVLAKRQQFREFPECRLSLADYYDRNKKAVDKTYSRLGAFIDGFVFDWKQRRIPKVLFDSADLVHWLALDVAEQALAASGYVQGRIPKERIGVIVGNSLNGETSRANSLRLRWPFVGRVFKEAAAARGIGGDEVELLEKDFEKRYKAFFPPMNGHSLSGALSNVIAGRICNFFDFNGGGYVVDGACASSLLAVITAAKSIAAGELDMAVAGGVDISLDINELTGFARVGALSGGEMKVYDKNAGGFLPGEGCGFAVLKDFELARRDGDCIYASIGGWGISSDGKGGIMTPSASGQALAIKKAYELSGYSMDEADFIEGHGTGTGVGDRIELEAILSLFGASGQSRKSLGITSLKSIVGHTKSAAGIGAFIKAVMAVNQRVLPPTANVDFPNQAFYEGHMPVYPIIAGEVLDPGKVMRAGVSAMGFGGINSHVTIESHGEPSEKFRPQLPYSSLLSSYQKTELLVFTADSREALAEKVGRLMEKTRGISVAEVTDLACELCKEADSRHAVRCCAVLTNKYQFAEKLMELRQSIIGNFPDEGRIYHDAGKSITVANRVRKTRVGLLFPGQGSQKLNMTKYLIDRFPWAKELALEVDAVFESKGVQGLLDRIYRPMDRVSSQRQKEEWSNGLKDVRYAHGAVVLSSLVWLEYFKRLGIRYTAAGGHSLGELAAFYAAGAYSGRELIELAAVRGLALSHAKEAGKMVGLKCSYEKALEILKKTGRYAVAANYNSPEQVTVSGTAEGIGEVVAIAGAEGVRAQILELDNAFHSKLVADCAEELRKASNLPASFRGGSRGVRLFSSAHGGEITGEVGLRDYFYAQMQKGVDFVPMMGEMRGAVDLLIETGPGKVLSNLNNSYMDDVRTLPAEGFANDDESLNSVLAALFAYGNTIDWEAVYRNRYVRKFEYPEEKSFIASPCESRPESGKGPDTFQNGEKDVSGDTAESAVKEAAAAKAPDSQDMAEAVLRMVADETGFDVENISPDLKLLEDLNLDSIKSAELFLKIADRFNVTDRVDINGSTDLTIGQMIENFKAAVEAGENGRLSRFGESGAFPGRADWVRNFVMTETVCGAGAAGEELPEKAAKGEAFIVVSEDGDRDEELLSMLGSWAGEVRPVDFTGLESLERVELEGKNLLIFLPGIGREESFGKSCPPVVKLLAGLNASLSAQLKRVMFIHANDSEAFEYNGLKAYISSLHHERPLLKIKSLAFEGGAVKDGRADLLLKELYSDHTDIHVKYGSDGARKIPAARLLQPEDYIRRSRQLEPGDVMLVTGGAKGITAECAFGLALKTGAGMALVGTTPGAGSEEVRKTLERYKTAGLAARYYTADVTDREELEAVIKEIESDLGDITGVIHGAGINRPRQAAGVSREEALEEIAPKLSGALNLAGIFSRKGLKLFAGMGSVIGVAGLPGNAWYAFSNENMKNVLLKFKKENPGTEVISIAYSLWKDVGMGTRLGGAANLVRLGAGVIDAEEGVRRFLHLTEFDPGCVETVVTSSLGGLDTWRRTTDRGAERLRFVENIIKLEPGVELVSGAFLSKERDIYLNHHIYEGTLLFPTVFGLEAMAQNVSYLTGVDDFSGAEINNLKLNIPIIVDREKGATIKIHAMAGERPDAGSPLKVDVRIFSESTDYGREHFSAEFVLKTGKGDQGKGPENGIGGKKTDARIMGAPYDLMPRQDLYNWLFFHGPLFHRIDRVYALEQDEVVASLAIKPKAEFEAEWYKGELPQRLLLGDPFLRDAGLQAGQLSIPKEISLPVEVESIEINRLDASQYFVRFKKISQEKDGMLSEICVFDNEGNVLEKYEGCKSRITARKDENPSVEQLKDIQGLYSRILHSHAEAFGDRVKIHPSGLGIYRLPGISLMEKEERHRLEKEILGTLTQKGTVLNLSTVPANGQGGTVLNLSTVSANGQEGTVLNLSTVPVHGQEGTVLDSRGEDPPEFELDWESSGRPFIRDRAGGRRLPVSISHDDTFLLYSTGKISQGCDIEPVKARELGAWEGLIGRDNISILHGLLQEGCELDTAGTSIWSALECFRKAASASGVAMGHYRKMDKGILFGARVDDIEYRVLAFPVAFLSEEKRIVAFTVEEREGAGIRKSAGSGGACFIDKGAGGQNVYNCRFKLSFKDIATLRRKMNYSGYAFYMGKLREMTLEPVLDELARDLGTGSWAWVTNDSGIRVFDELSIGDELLGRIWVSKYDKSRVDVAYEWHRIGRDSEMTLAAAGTLGSGWVQVTDQGLVRRHPMPGYLDALFTGIGTGALPETAGRMHGPSQPRLDQGEAVWENKAFPRPAFVHSESFDTTLEDSNLVGNLYFAHYYQWQSRTKDMYLHKALGKYFNPMSAARHELFYSRAEVKHLREAMPFDRITVKMAIRSIHARGIKFYFEYDKSTPDGHTEKIAFSELDAVWMRAGGKDEGVIPGDMPGELVKALLRTVEEGQPSVK